jgi:hypothetical protein
MHRKEKLAAARRLQRVVGWSGVAVAVLFGLGNALWAFDAPKPGASRSEIVAFYERAANRIVAGGSMSLVSIALFVFFAAGLRRSLAEADDEILATTAFGGALLGAAAGLGAETINMAGAMRAREGELSEELAESVFETAQVLGYNAAGLGVGTFAAATAAVALRTDTILPRWLAALTGVVGVALMTPLSRVVLGPAIVLLAVIAERLAR